MLTPAEADERIAAHLSPLPVERRPLGRCAGAVLREDLFAERDSPPFDRVAMDGVALLSDAVQRGVRRFHLEATQAAGDPARTLASDAGCIEVMTGAVLPTGCDAVVPVEQITTTDAKVELAADLEVAAWANVHRRATDARQGDLLLSAGTRLSAPGVAIAASSGQADLPVSRPPTIAVLSTGNELVEPGAPILDHQIRRSNAYAVVGALQQHGFHEVVDDHVLDDAGALRAHLEAHLDGRDALILSGGVSMGRFDLVPAALADLGVEVVFHKVAQRPGKPLLFGVAPSGAAVFALPGNPVSTVICLARYVLPALCAAMGQHPPAPETIALAEAVTIDRPLTLFVPVVVDHDDRGQAWARPAPTNGSGDLTSLGGTDGFVELPAGPGTFPRGTVTRRYRW